MVQLVGQHRLFRVMRPRVNVAFPACLLALLGAAQAAGGFYGKALAAKDAGDTIRTFGPRSLLQLYKALGVEWTANASTTSNACGRDLGVLLLAAERREKWALKILDASSKIPTGILDGNLIDMGMYDECVSSRGEFSNVKIQGRHCMYSIGLRNDNDSLPVYPTLSICLPATCNATDLSRILNATIGRISNLMNLGLDIKSQQCASLDQNIWDTEFIVCFTILMMFVGFLITCSVCDVVYHSYGIRHESLRVLGCFSLQKNAAMIVSTNSKEGNLPVIHGIRFLSIAWIVLGHQYVAAAFAPNVNTVDILEWIQSWRSLFVFTAPFAVDTFFTLSGFLMTYLFLKQVSKQRRFNVPMYYVHRFVRLTPPVIALLVFSIVFLPKIGSGARWDSVMDSFFGGCRTSWWQIILYVQNFLDKEEDKNLLCLGHLWYLAVDMQLFWISPLILYPLYAKPKLGLGILLSLILASLIVPASIVGVNKYPVQSFTHLSNLTLTMKVFEEVYEMPYTRAGPWLVGILLGYEMYNNKRTLSKTILTIGWLSAVGSFAFCTFGLRSFLDPDYKYNAVWETFFATVSRPLWAAAVSWIIYSSANNYAGPISHLLNWKYFQPLSRLSYCIYLVHLVFQLTEIAALRTSMYFSDYNVWQAYLSKFTGSIAIAFIFSLMFESPILVFEKMILKRNKEPQYESQTDICTPTDEENIARET